MELVTASILAALSALVGTPGDVVVGGDRPVVVHVPPGYDPEVPMPLLLVLHGYGGSGETTESRWRFQPVAHSRGLLYAHPDGTVDCFGNRFWTSITDWCNPCETVVDDSAYLGALITEIQTVLNVDPKRIYFVGHSNGGSMSFRMACQHAHAIAAIVSHAGYAYADPAQCLPVSGVHILHIHGTADSNVLYYTGGTFAALYAFADLPVPDGICLARYPGAVASVEEWAGHNGCDLALAPGPRLDLVQGLAGSETVATRSTQGCRDEGSAELWTVQGGEHIPPYRESFAATVVDWLLKHPKGIPTRAALTLAPESGLAPLEVALSDAGSTSMDGTTITSYAWDFGDGASAAGMWASHTYTSPGRYLASLTITTEGGQVDTASLPVTVLCPSGDISPWTATDVGEPVYAGGVEREETEEGRVFEICAGGTSFGGVDKIFLVHQEIEGDLQLTARVVDVQSGAAGAFVGLTFRESLSATDSFGAVGFELRAQPDQKGLFRFRFRVRAGSGPSFRTGAAVLTFPCWLRLERRGDSLRGWSSLDGKDWTLVGEAAPEGLPAVLLAGVAAYGRDVDSIPFEPLRATVSEPDMGPLPAFVRGACNQDGVVDISDAVCMLSWLFTDGAAPGCIAAVNTNGDGAVDLSDAVWLLAYLFVGGPAPFEPHLACAPGSLPSDGELGCGMPPPACE